MPFCNEFADLFLFWKFSPSWLVKFFFLLYSFVLSGAGPHPRALSGRIICCSWWLFTVVLLACYFSNLSSSKTSESTHLSVKGFEDLANQDMIEYGCLAGSSTLAFFKVHGHLITYRSPIFL